jgi:glycosyltransferase involved in cell wall biosynthesis
LTSLGLRPYREGDDPCLGSVEVSVVILTRDEEANIGRCLSSMAWADQVIVVDSGSTDGTLAIARSLGVEVVEQPWLGYSDQRDFALRLPQIRHNWVYFVDADEWVSPYLAQEIAVQLRAPSCAGFAHRLRLIFLGTWIRHCGWYSASLVVRLVDRRYAKFNGNVVGERACVDGSVHRLYNDIVDEDLKGLARWMHKHVRYAELEAERRSPSISLVHRLCIAWSRDSDADTRPFIRRLLRDVAFPAVPCKPLALFVYMYIVRLGLLDGKAGLLFCFYHAWYESNINALLIEAEAVTGENSDGTQRRWWSRRRYADEAGTP